MFCFELHTHRNCINIKTAVPFYLYIWTRAWKSPLMSPIQISGKLKAQHFSSPSSRLVENNTSGSGGLGSSFTSGCLENIYSRSSVWKYLLSIWHRQPLSWVWYGTWDAFSLLYDLSRVWEQCGGVLPAAHPVLDAADCGHAPALADVHCQGGPGDSLYNMRDAVHKTPSCF